MRNVYQGTYDDRTIYLNSQIVEYQNNLYACFRSQVTGCPPPDKDIWKLVGKVTGVGRTYINPSFDPDNCHWSRFGEQGEPGSNE